MSVVMTRRIGGGSTSSLVNQSVAGESPSGERDTTNRLFMTTRSFINGTLKVYYNGQRLSVNDYIEQGSNVFRLIYVKPYAVDDLRVDYIIKT